MPESRKYGAPWLLGVGRGDRAEPSEHCGVWREFGYSPSRGHDSTPEMRVRACDGGLRNSMVFGLQLGPLKLLLEFIECCEVPKCT